MTNPLHDTLFAPHAERDDAFLRFADGGTLTHRAFAERAGRIAGALVEAGLQPGDRLAVQVAKSPDALALYAACVRAGIVLLPLNTAYTPAEISYFVGDAEAAMLVCDPAALEALTPVAREAGARIMTLGADGGGTLAEAVEGADAPEPAERGTSDLAAFLYTSGTTGRSKGAMLSQDNLLSNAHVLTEAWRFTGDDVLIHALPIFHTHGLFVAVNVSLMAGGSMIWLSRFDAGEVLAALPRATAMMGVPTFYVRLLDHPGLSADATKGMRLFVSGSAPMLTDTHRAWTERTGHRILERYGMTETNMNTSNPYAGDRRPGTVGPPLPGVEVRVTGEGRAPLPAGETGMVEVRGPNVFRGYWNLPEKTAEELGPDGWFVTGDLGVMSDDGYLSIVGREKDLVISGGYNVYPKEVEQALDALPGVSESAVIGVPHPDLGEAVVAVYVPEAGAAPDAEALSAALSEALARFKQPRRLIPVDALPRNTMGKVQKAVLRELYADAFAPEGAGS